MLLEEIRDLIHLLTVFPEVLITQDRTRFLLNYYHLPPQSAADQLYLAGTQQRRLITEDLRLKN